MGKSRSKNIKIPKFTRGITADEVRRTVEEEVKQARIEQFNMLKDDTGFNEVLGRIWEHRHDGHIPLNEEEYKLYAKALNHLGYATKVYVVGSHIRKFKVSWEQ